MRLSKSSMNGSLTRRHFGAAATAGLFLNIWPGRGVRPAAAASNARAAIALRAAFQSLAWLGAEAGIYKRHGLDMALTLETGGPRAAAGLARGSEHPLARAIGVPPRRINEIVLGKRAVTADTDLRLARYFKMSEGFFLGLQTDYELMERKRQIGDKLKAIRPRAA